ncbi:site-specific integrase [Pontixanthobacter sp.]|uniref:site-specific integrase n=1 Tax=Pontixanthobacter sp. TaxID=2792078 RepID=UPI003C79B8AA
MAGIQNVTRKQGTYYYRKLIRLGPDKPFRLRMSLKTTCRKRAGLLAPALTLIGERVAMNMMSNMARDGLTGAQRAEIYRRQMLEERDRLETMHATLHIAPPDDHDDIGKALSLRLGASEMAAQDGAKNGKVEDFLFAHIDPDDDDAPVLILAWSDIAASIEHEGADQAALARLAEIGVSQSVLREAMARKVVNEARIVAIREFRDVLANPGSAYPAVPIDGYGVAPQNYAAPAAPAASTQSQPVVAGPWAAMLPTEAAKKFFEHNPRTGGKDGTSRQKNGKPWTSKTRAQFELPALLLEQVMGGRPLATIIHDDLVKLDQCFEKLHGPSFRKSPKHRDMTIWEIVEETEARVAAGEKQAEREVGRKRKGGDSVQKKSRQLQRADLGFGVVTTNRHWGFLRQLTTWFQKHQPLPELDYGAFIMNDDRNQRELRSPYTVEQGREVFSLPPWTGSKSHARRMQAGNLIVHDAWYFVPLIAWYSGMRRDEICGLEVADLELEDGHWHFCVRPNNIRRLKTISSERKVPVASALQHLGLIDYVSALSEEGETDLFPELASESNKGTMGDAFYKRIWTKIAGDLSFLEAGQGMHSFRHTAIDFMKAAGITPEIRADFAGHSLKSETEGRYSKTHMALLRDAVATIPNVTDQLKGETICLSPSRLRLPRTSRQ